jgi:hypothetical protein
VERPRRRGPGEIETDLSAMMGATAAGPLIKNLDRALRQLDR